MSRLPRRLVSNLTKQLNAVDADCREKLEKALLAIDYTDMTEGINKAVEVMEMFCDNGSLKSAEVSALFYDAVRKAQTGKMLGAKATTGRSKAATEQSVRSFAQKLVEGNKEMFVSMCVSRLGYEMKRAAGETIKWNAKNDSRKVKFARVASDDCKCEFCLMLSSRGFKYSSNKTAGDESGHYHANCECQIVPSFDEDGMEGYDPAAMEAKWKDMVAERKKRAAERQAAKEGTN